MPPAPLYLRTLWRYTNAVIIIIIIIIKTLCSRNEVTLQPFTLCLVSLWHGGDPTWLAIYRSTGRGLSPVSTPLGAWACYLHLCASVTKQYNLVPVKVRWRSEAGKVTEGLATHWPCVTDFVVYPPTGSRPTSGRWAKLTIGHCQP